jgi:hypothetical protein
MTIKDLYHEYDNINEHIITMLISKKDVVDLLKKKKHILDDIIKQSENDTINLKHYGKMENLLKKNSILLSEHKKNTLIRSCSIEYIINTLG